jgi:hypothetical protein
VSDDVGEALDAYSRTLVSAVERLEEVDMEPSAARGP